MQITGKTLACSLAATCLLPGFASASLILIGASTELQSNLIDGVFNTEPGQFSDEALNLVHGSLMDSGIQTDAMITIVPVDSDHGLSLMVLVDGAGSPGIADDSSLSLFTTAPGSSSLYINDNPIDITGHINGGSGMQSAFGFFSWDSTSEGDALAWADLQYGDHVTFLFNLLDGDLPTIPGLQSENSIQFITWQGGAWAVASTSSFNELGQFAFAAGVVPAPGAIALLPLAALAARRRRRTRG